MIPTGRVSGDTHALRRTVLLTCSSLALKISQVPSRAPFPCRLPRQLPTEGGGQGECSHADEALTPRRWRGVAATLLEVPTDGWRDHRPTDETRTRSEVRIVLSRGLTPPGPLLRSSTHQSKAPCVESSHTITTRDACLGRSRVALRYTMTSKFSRSGGVHCQGARDRSRSDGP